ncbi:MAG TPA: pitrilysin family protein [Thermoanaerobaculia bacterium]|nr:pitrilysin family protein [Thermoanaerobaculia bacterium]
MGTDQKTPIGSLAIDRSSPPAPGEIRPFHFPPFLRRFLPCGLTVLAARFPGVPLINLELLAPAGAQLDPPDGEGLATLTAALLDEGTAGRSAMEIATGIEQLGGYLATGADWDTGYIGTGLLRRHLGAGMRLVAEVATTPSFPEEEIARARQQRLTEILRRRHSPAVLADEQLARAIYRGTSYAHSVLGSARSIADLGRDAIVDFYRRYFILAGSTLIAVGDLEPELLLAEAAAAFGGPPPATARPQAPAIRPAPLPGIAVHIVDRPGAAQTELRLGHAGVSLNHPDFMALSVLNTLLGGKFTSRINLNLRERHGYTYGASSRFAGRLGPGPFVVAAAVATEAAGPAAREVLGELRRIREEPVALEEMEETRSYILGVFPYTLQTVGDLAKRLEDLAVYGLPDDYFNRYLACVAALSREEVLELARRHLDPDHAAIVAVGPADLLRPQLEALGELTVTAPDS